MPARNLFHYCQSLIALIDKTDLNAPHPQAGECLGYIQGVLDSDRYIRSLPQTSNEKSMPDYCIGSNRTLEEIVRVFIKSTQDYPTTMSMSGWGALRVALVNNYPCK